MKEISAEELKEELMFHKEWLRQDTSGLHGDIMYAYWGKRLTLVGYDLSEHDLSFSDLTNANLSGSRLGQVIHSKFQGVNLSHANLATSAFWFVDFSSVNFRHADLSCAKMVHCEVTNADFTGITWVSPPLRVRPQIEKYLTNL